MELEVLNERTLAADFIMIKANVPVFIGVFDTSSCGGDTCPT